MLMTLIEDDGTLSGEAFTGRWWGPGAAEPATFRLEREQLREPVSFGRPGVLRRSGPLLMHACESKRAMPVHRAWPRGYEHERKPT